MMLLDLFERLGKLIEEGTLGVMIPLMGTCFVICFLAVDRFRYLYEPRSFFKFIPSFGNSLKRDKVTFEQCLKDFIVADNPGSRSRLENACLKYQTPHGRFVQRCLLGRGRRGGKIQHLETQQAELTENLAIESSIPMLSTFARTAPLMGLMGTVTGMIATFSAMMLSSGTDPKALSSGIRIALLATNVGLVVSLPGIVALGILSRKGQVLQEEIRKTSLLLRNQKQEEAHNDLKGVCREE